MDNDRADKCPICNGDNACAIAAGRKPESCWCMSVAIPEAVLESLPESERGKRCICQACVSQGREAN